MKILWWVFDFLLSCCVWSIVVALATVPSRMTQPNNIRIAESVWRTAAREHRNQVLQLLLPGLLVSCPNEKKKSHNSNHHDRDHLSHSFDNCDSLTGLDPKNPVYNFLIEYYGLKGPKGTRRLMRWSPPLALIFLTGGEEQSERLRQIRTISDYGLSLNNHLTSYQRQLDWTRTVPVGKIVLEGACEDDLLDTLHLRGAMIDKEGVAYSPVSFYGRQNIGDDIQPAIDHIAETRNVAKAFLWYRAVLQQTLSAEPVLYCHGLHEWAMLYHPEGASPPPSAKYQAHLPKRVSREVINQLVELRGVNCTHVDALRYFAPAAAPLNYHGCPLPRTDQLKLEQPACVHANMDLLKMALRLQPFLDPQLLVRVLNVALRARKLDVAASPYDATAYGVDMVPVETIEGRTLYRKEQLAIMDQAQHVRRDLLQAYDQFLYLAFDHAILKDMNQVPTDDLVKTTFVS